MFNKMKTTHHCEGSSDDATGFEIVAPVQDEGPSTGELLHNNSLPSLENKFPSSPDLHHKRSVNFVSRDDDENYISRRSKNIRVRKFSGYKLWKVSPKLRDHDSCADEGARHAYCSGETYHERDGGLDSSPVKKRKLCDKSCVVTSDTGVCSESFSKCHDECALMNKNSIPHLHGANEERSSIKNHAASDYSTDSQVRLSIKSFKVPEVLVEVPVTATLGSLKTTILEAISSVLRGRLHVEVIVRGKMIRDDSNTVMQSGISHNCNLDSLGFMLEPRSPQAPSPRSQNDHSVLPASNERKPSTSAFADSVSDEPSPSPSLNKQVKSDHNSVPIACDALPEKSQESKALTLSAVTIADSLAIVPMDQKSKRSELAQRRTRRPFSVVEVEALVQAVEELGTGRWRNVNF